MSIFAERINKLDYLASHDQLTNILNRNGFYDRFNHLIETIDSETTFTFLMYDFDDFKDINDHYGHLGGDQVLKVSSKIVSEFLPQDALFCRFGGEEFLVFIPNISLSESLNLAEEMRKLIENQNLIYQDKSIKTTASIGLYNCSKSVDSNLDSLIEKADKALYRSKKDGKNKVSSFD